MQQSVGESIRQLRRQRSLTQTELGGDHFSKSYVSAVERGKIIPSVEALRFFAKQLDQAHDYFHVVARENEHEAQLTTVGQIGFTYEEVASLLGIVLATVEQGVIFSSSKPFLLSTEVTTLLPKEEQARYALLTGIMARQKNDRAAALAAFEQALALALDAQQPAILYELGMHYFQADEYEAALTYYKRALKFLQEGMTTKIGPTLRLNIHLQCGNTYRVLGAYKQAISQYELALPYLKATSTMKMAAQLYMGLGYCIYAYTYQNTMPTESALPSLHHLSMEEMEQNFRRALDFVVKSTALYQMYADMVNESAACLVQVMFHLDICTRRQQLVLVKEGAFLQIEYLQPLAAAEEQCHRVLLLSRDAFTATTLSLQALEEPLYITLAYLVRVFVIRATYARLNNEKDTAEHQLAQASALCQQVLPLLDNPQMLQELVQNSTLLQDSHASLQSFALPDALQVTQLQREGQGKLSLGKQEIYFALGEVMEELGRTAIDPTAAHDFYEKANQCFHSTLPLNVAQTSTPAAPIFITNDIYDTTDTTRRYQRYIAILEERLRVVPALSQETIKSLLEVLKESLSFT